MPRAPSSGPDARMQKIAHVYMHGQQPQPQQQRRASADSGPRRPSRSGDGGRPRSGEHAAGERCAAPRPGEQGARPQRQRAAEQSADAVAAVFLQSLAGDHSPPTLSAAPPPSFEAAVSALPRRVLGAQGERLLSGAALAVRDCWTAVRAAVTAPELRRLADGEGPPTPSGDRCLSELAAACEQLAAACRRALQRALAGLAAALEGSRGARARAASDALSAALHQRVEGAAAVCRLGAALCDPAGTVLREAAAACSEPHWPECRRATEVAGRCSDGAALLSAARTDLAAAAGQGDLQQLQRGISQLAAAAAEPVSHQLAPWGSSGAAELVAAVLAPFREQAERMRRGREAERSLRSALQRATTLASAAERMEVVKALKQAAGDAPVSLRGAPAAGPSAALRELAAAAAARGAVLDSAHRAAAALAAAQSAEQACTALARAADWAAAADSPHTAGGAPPSSAVAASLRAGAAAAAAAPAGSNPDGRSAELEAALGALGTLAPELPRPGARQGAWLAEDAKHAERCTAAARSGLAQLIWQRAAARSAALASSGDHLGAGALLRKQPAPPPDCAAACTHTIKQAWEDLYAASQFRVKTHFRGTIRITTLSPEAPMARVLKELRGFLGVTPAEASRGLGLKYCDQDDDYVTVVTDEEYRECWRQWAARKAASRSDAAAAESERPLDLYVELLPAPEASAAPLPVLPATLPEAPQAAPRRTGDSSGHRRVPAAGRRSGGAGRGLTQTLLQVASAAAEAGPPAAPPPPAAAGAADDSERQRAMGRWVQDLDLELHTVASEISAAVVPGAAKHLQQRRWQQDPAMLDELRTVASEATTARPAPAPAAGRILRRGAHGAPAAAAKRAAKSPSAAAAAHANPAAGPRRPPRPTSGGRPAAAPGAPPPGRRPRQSLGQPQQQQPPGELGDAVHASSDGDIADDRRTGPWRGAEYHRPPPRGRLPLAAAGPLCVAAGDASHTPPGRIIVRGVGVH
eukprot:TRINITY_DN19090_c0_g1_i4.p1 TRINITY_DN19090_c0_g1~~TRINITY_DN19090_c0_g1_i4.p1  ORF type:complete len:1016 (+),score=302.42 TRINITY_DN19090_c0_g1_i4:97-3048(+)